LCTYVEKLSFLHANDPIKKTIYVTNKEALDAYYTVIKHDGHKYKKNIENTSRRRVFCTFLECSQMLIKILLIELILTYIIY